MKKKMRKLTLSRETLGSLERSNLTRVAGGVGTSEECLVATGCECGGTNGCMGPTLEHTCGTVCDIPTWHCTRCSIC